jgi:hypothetical protein
MAIDGGYSKFNTKDDMTYSVTDKNHFVHNNMIPWTKLRQPYSQMSDDHMNDINQRKLELFNGEVDGVNYRHREEVKPFFAPVIGMTNPYGMPDMSDILKSRYNTKPDKTKERPFEQVRVTPGLNLGYNEVGKDGYQDTYRPTEKTIDELRPLSNPKIVYGGRVGTMDAREVHRQQGSKMGKHRPLGFYEADVKDCVKMVNDTKGFP